MSFFRKLADIARESNMRDAERSRREQAQYNLEKARSEAYDKANENCATCGSLVHLATCKWCSFHDIEFSPYEDEFSPHNHECCSYHKKR